MRSGQATFAQVCLMLFMCNVGGGATYGCTGAAGAPLTTACTELAPAPFVPQ